MKEIPTPAGALSTFLAQPVSRVYQWLILWLRRHTTIRFRIYLFAGVMLLMFYSVTLYLFVAYVADIKSERMMSLHFVVSDLLTSAAGQALRRGDKDHIVPLVNTLVDTTEISRIAVVDSTGDVFVERTDTRKASSDIETFSVPVIWRGVDVNATAFLDTDAISVKGRDVTVGSVTCEIDNEALSELVWTAFLARGYIVLIPIILSFPVFYILAMSLVQPSMRSMPVATNWLVALSSATRIRPLRLNGLSASGRLAGKGMPTIQGAVNQNSLPCPGAPSTPIFPPSRRTICLQIESPNPLPP